MKKKIVMEVHTNCEKCRTKALKTLAKAHGVEFIGLEGERRDKVVVIGDGIDSIDWAISLRKKVGCTDIISVNAYLILIG